MSSPKLKVDAPTTRSVSNFSALSSIDNSSQSSISIQDFMSTIQEFRKEVLISSETLSTAQASQFKDLKDDIKKLSSDVKAENALLREEVNMLKEKVSSLEGSDSSVTPSSIVTHVLHKTYDREKRASNVLIYGVVEPTSSNTSQRIIDDKVTLDKILRILGNIDIATPKLIRLGRLRPDVNRPLKAILNSKEEAEKLLKFFSESRLSCVTLPHNFRTVRDKTDLQRRLLKSCHSELNQRNQDGEEGLQIKYVDGFPKVVLVQSKNGSFHQRPNVSRS
jgi:hypothetical protein